jgi:hypothetical protein
MLVVAEIGKKGNEHLMFNAAMTDVLKNNFGDGHIVFFGAPDQFRLIADRIDVSGIDHRPVTVTVASTKIEWLYKVWLEASALVRIFFFARRKKADVLFFYSMLPCSLLFLNLLCRFFTPRMKVITTLHGELEFMKRENAKFMERVYSKCLLWAFRLKSRYRKYLVLGDSIKINLLGMVPFLAATEIITIPHPYIFANDAANGKKALGNTVRYAHVGVASTAKNSQFIFQLGKTFRDDIERGTMKLEIIGMLKPDLAPYVNELVQYERHQDMLSRDLFEEKIKGIDFALFFYDNTYYKLCSSGAIFDAISFKKPIVAIKNDYFQYIFSLFSTPPGFLCENMDEVIARVDFINKNYNFIYVDLLASLEQAQKVLSIEHVSALFRDEIRIAYN